LVLLDQTSYKRLFEESYEPLCNLAFSVLDNYDLSEDVVQEVFVHLWQLRNKLEIRTNIKNYLFSAVRNKAIEKLRRQKLDEKYRLDVKQSQISFEEDDQGDYEKYLIISKLYKSIDKLPDKCRMIFKMAKLDGMTYNEISEELNLSIKTIESQMRRAFILLRDMLKDV
jgi:RNA polymerase sigma-70 factor (ECF subfamily)